MSRDVRQSSSARPLGTVVLVGHMGAGKTTVGRRLANRLGLPFVDADAEIEAAAGCTILDFFERHGEQAFREGERRVIARLLAGPPQVLATGGGAFMDVGTRALIGQSGTSVWLRAEAATLVDRIKRRNHRPLVNTGDPREVIERMIAERNAIYALADITVESGDAPHARVVGAIVKALDDLDRAPPPDDGPGDDPNDGPNDGPRDGPDYGPGDGAGDGAGDDDCGAP